MNKKLLDIARKFHNDMQKMCNDNKSGFTSISISSPLINNGKEIVIAQKTTEKKKNYRCRECGCELNDGEGKTFTVCTDCWGKEKK